MKSKELLLPAYLEMQNQALVSLMDAYRDLLAGTDLISFIQSVIVSNKEKSQRIESFIDNIQNTDVQDYIRIYQRKKDWGDVCKEVFGYRDTHYCMKAVNRYLRKTDFEKLT